MHTRCTHAVHTLYTHAHTLHTHAHTLYTEASGLEVQGPRNRNIQRVIATKKAPCIHRIKGFFISKCKEEKQFGRQRWVKGECIKQAEEVLLKNINKHILFAFFG